MINSLEINHLEVLYFFLPCRWTGCGRDRRYPNPPNLLIRPCEVFNRQSCCRSEVEDPDMGLCWNPSCRTLRVPTYEMTCLTHLKRQRAGSIKRPVDSALWSFSMLNDVVGRRSKTPTWACAETHHVGLFEYRPTRWHFSHISNVIVPEQSNGLLIRPCEVFQCSMML